MIVDRLIALVASLEAHAYGEDVNMLEHSLQTAAAVADAGGSDALVVAALFHDVGHVLDDALAGEWGVAEHAEAGARHLEQWLTSDVAEPIRMHVDAKRYLVATEPTYLATLSRASTETLRLQGGPFSASEAERFAASPHAEAALALRRGDDAGKVAENDAGKVAGATVASIDVYRPLIAAVLRKPVATTDDAVDATWARDACSCAACRHPSNGQHLIDATELDGWVVVNSHDTTEALIVDLCNADGRTHRCVIATSSPDVDPNTTWDAGHIATITRRITDASGHLDDFVNDLAEYGIAIASNVATESGTVLEFARRLGYVRDTNYGALFDVRAEPAPINLAYTPTGLPLHTDNPYRDPVPTVQLLHCLRAADEGGGSLFSDGFHAAERLRAESPDDFDLLAGTPVSYRFVGGDVDLRASVPMIELDVSGRVRRVTVNNRSMEPMPPTANVGAFYVAYARFAALLAEPTNVIELTLGAGQVIGFDNRRVLHGRRGFASDPNRHLQGCYIDIDAIHSAARLTRR